MRILFCLLKILNFFGDGFCWIVSLIISIIETCFFLFVYLFKATSSQGEFYLDIFTVDATNLLVSFAPKLAGTTSFFLAVRGRNQTHTNVYLFVWLKEKYLISPFGNFFGFFGIFSMRVILVICDDARTRFSLYDDTHTYENRFTL